MKRLLNRKDGYFAISIVLSIILYSCDDIIEEDISNDIITMITPISGQIITSNSVLFQWNLLAGADNYRLKIQNETNAIILDSLIDGASFNYPLNPGEYKWWMRAENNAYESDYNMPIEFSVRTSDDLSNQTVFLGTPSNGYYSNNSSNIIVTWTAIDRADSYTFELEKNIFGNRTTVHQETNITGTSFVINASLFDEDAEYIWKVKAVNSSNSTETAYSTRAINIDTTAPNSANLLNPANNSMANVNDLVTFSWDNGTDQGANGSTISSILEISTDSSFTNPEVYPEETESINITFNNTGDYYWRVINIDDAGNQSNYSDIRKITIG